MQLEIINYNCHRCISQLLVVTNDPQEKDTAPEGVKKSFLLDRTLENRRKKIFNIENKSLSNSSYRFNDKSLDGAENLEYEKSLLNKIFKSCSSKIKSDQNSEISNCNSKCDANEN